MSWTVDQAHTAIEFSVRHMMISKVRGSFEQFEVTVHADENNPSASVVEAKIAAASINTREAQRDAHLRSADFFNAEAFPHMVFRSKSFTMQGNSRGVLVGDLTIRDVTRQVTLDVEYLGQAKSPWGTVSAGFNASAKINRKDWGLEWNVALETGGLLVGEEVEIHIETELVKQPEAQAAA